MKYIELEQGSPEWHAFRRTHIGASDAPVIMGASPFKSYDSLLKEKATGAIEKSNFAMERGTRLEPVARALFCQEVCDVKPAVVVHPELEWASASLDGVSEDETLIVEIKCGSKTLFDDTKKGKVPEHYRIQMQHQMFVCNLAKCYFCVFHESKIALQVVERDEPYIQKMIKKEQTFLRELEAYKPSETVSDDEDSISFIEFEHERARKIKDRILLICDQEAALKKEKDLLKAEIFDISPQENFILDGTRFYKSQRTSYDMRKMASEGIEIEKYKKTSEPFWLIKAPKKR